MDFIIDVQRMYLLKDSLWNGFFLHGGAIAKIATNYGPLPAGITRFGSVFFKKCPRCIAEREKSIMSDPVLDRDEVKSLAVMKD